MKKKRNKVKEESRKEGLENIAKVENIDSHLSSTEQGESQGEGFDDVDRTDQFDLVSESTEQAVEYDFDGNFKSFSEDDSQQINESSIPFEKALLDEENLQRKEKKRSKVVKIVVSLISVLVVIAAIVFVAPIVLQRLGDNAITEGDYEDAAFYYEFCFGANDSKKRLGVANATGLIDGGETEKGINLLLDNGITVNVKYDLNGGEFINRDRKTVVTLKEKSEFGDLYKARKDYYAFDNWSLTAFSYAPEFDDTVFDVSLKANFTLNKYKISYTNLFSDKIENPEEYTYETKTITLKNPIREGYTFLYWKGTEIDGEASTVVIPQGSHGDRAYIANWEPNKYVVTMNPDVECQIDNPVTVTFDDDYELPTITKRGYIHKGWSDGNKTYFKGVWNTLKDVSVEPVWEIINYTLKYDLNGGKIAKENPSTYTVISEDIVITEPTRHGYTFKGWKHSKKSDPKKDIVIKQGSIGDYDFSAVWQGNPYVITLDTKGGNVSTNTVNVVYGDEYTIPAPTRPGYTFTGWYNGNTKYADGVWNKDSDLKVSATWNANKYAVSLNANGGTVANNRLTVTYDSAYSLPTPSRYGYTFTGWYNGSSQFATNGIWNSVSDIALTAGWQGNPHILHLDANGGMVSAASVNVVVGSNYKIPTPTKKGHSFTGWYNSSTKYPDSGVWDRDNDVSLVATWSVNSYEAKLNTSGGSVSKSSVVCKYGANYSLPTATRTGYTFLGWYNGTSKMQNSGAWTWDSDLSLVAKWESNTYAVTLDAYGGNVYPSTVSVKYDAAYSLPVPSKKGYSFAGWYTGYTKITDGVWKRAENLSLKASWNVNTYRATLNLNGGSSSKTYVSCDYGSSYTLPTPTKSGYTFRGWYYNSSKMTNSGTWNWDTNITITAEWDPNKYTVSLNANGGSLSTTRLTVTYNSKYALPEPERKGYSFVGWYSGYSGSATKYATTGNWNYAGDISLVAQWEIEKHTINLEANGGDVSKSKITVEYYAYFTLPTPTRTGYTFLGWFDDEGTRITGSERYMWESSITLEAEWEANSYSISLDANGGAVSDGSLTMVYGKTYSLPTPEREGYEFIGWYNGNTKCSSNGKWSVASSTTLVAKWELKKYIMEFDANGGTLSKNKLTVEYTAQYSLPTPSRKGYTFVGWYGDNGMVNNSGTYNWNTNMSLGAKWNANSYVISLNASGGNCNVSSIKMEFDETYSLPTPSKSGYDFVGWYNGSSKVSSSGTWSIADDATLTARWDEKEYVISLDADGGKASKTSVKVSINEKYSLPTPTKTGYTFVGWFYGDEQFDKSGTWQYEQDIRLTARWEGEVCSVTLNPNGGTVSPQEMSIEYGEQYALPTPYRDGYNFEGWFKGSSKVSDSGNWKIDSSSVTLKAKWKAA